MVKLLTYDDRYKKQTLDRITDFYGFHEALINGKSKLSNEDYI